MGVDRAQAGNGGEVEAEDAMKVAAEVELGLVALGLLALPTDRGQGRVRWPWSRKGRGVLRSADRTRASGFRVAVKRERLLEGEEMFGAVVADEGLGEGECSCHRLAPTRPVPPSPECRASSMRTALLLREANGD